MRCEKQKTCSRQLTGTGILAPQRGFEPPAYRLGVPAHVSYRVVRGALTCPQTRMNQRFFKE